MRATSGNSLGRYKVLCRRCYNLAYESQNKTAHDRALRKHQAIRMRIGGSGSLAEDFADKPKGMQWQTYWRLCREAAEAETQSWLPFGFTGMLPSSGNNTV
jgi:hypothetical protein